MMNEIQDSAPRNAKFVPKLITVLKDALILFSSLETTQDFRDEDMKQLKRSVQDAAAHMERVSMNLDQFWVPIDIETFSELHASQLHEDAPNFSAVIRRHLRDPKGANQTLDLRHGIRDLMRFCISKTDAQHAVTVEELYHVFRRLSDRGLTTDVIDNLRGDHKTPLPPFKALVGELIARRELDFQKTDVSRSGRHDATEHVVQVASIEEWHKLKAHPKNVAIGPYVPLAPEIGAEYEQTPLHIPTEPSIPSGWILVPEWKLAAAENLAEQVQLEIKRQEAAKGYADLGLQMALTVYREGPQAKQEGVE